MWGMWGVRGCWIVNALIKLAIRTQGKFPVLSRVVVGIIRITEIRMTLFHKFMGCLDNSIFLKLNFSEDELRFRWLYLNQRSLGVKFQYRLGQNPKAFFPNPAHNAKPNVRPASFAKRLQLQCLTSLKNLPVEFFTVNLL